MKIIRPIQILFTRGYPWKAARNGRAMFGCGKARILHKHEGDIFYGCKDQKQANQSNAMTRTTKTKKKSFVLRNIDVLGWIGFTGSVIFAIVLLSFSRGTDDFPDSFEQAIEFAKTGNHTNGLKAYQHQLYADLFFPPFYSFFFLKLFDLGQYPFTQWFDRSFFVSTTAFGNLLLIQSIVDWVENSLALYYLYSNPDLDVVYFNVITFLKWTLAYTSGTLAVLFFLLWLLKRSWWWKPPKTRYVLENAS
jgi:hypothetical protein